MEMKYRVKDLVEYADFDDYLLEITLRDEINFKSVSLVRSFLNHAVRKYPDLTPTINITSQGGDLFAVFAIIDLIKAFPGKVNTRVWGFALSGAALILAAGTGKRQVSENSFVMVHDIWSRPTDTALDEGEPLDDPKGRVIKHTYFTILQNTTLREMDTICHLVENEIYMDAPSAILNGFADEIII